MQGILSKRCYFQQDQAIGSKPGYVKRDSPHQEIVENEDRIVGKDPVSAKCEKCDGKGCSDCQDGKIELPGSKNAPPIEMAKTT